MPIRFDLSIAVLFWSSLAASALAEVPIGSIRGAITTADHQAKYVGELAVVICDARTGVPLHAETRKPIVESKSFDAFSDIWHSVQNSGFEFQDVPAGEYRLIAQSWSGTRGLQEMKFPSAVSFLHGVAEQVQVKPGEQTTVFIRPLGTGQLSIYLDPDAEGSIVFVSTEPMKCEPLLGFRGWGDPFIKNVIAATHHSRPCATIHGLPTDRDLYVGVYCYDNLAGFGGGRARAGADAVVTIPLYGAWSNGKDEPPARLLPLTEHMEKSGATWIDLMQPLLIDKLKDKWEHIDDEDAWNSALMELDRNIVIPEFGEVTVKDILAAESYKQLRASHKRQRERRSNRGQSPPALPDAK